jgi:hypothetical protein
VTHVGVYRDNSVDSFLAAWKKRTPHDGVPGGIKHVWKEGALPATTTGKDGRFTVTGVGAERVVALRLRGAGIAEAEAWVVNRPGFDPGPINRATADNQARMMGFPFGRKWLLHGPDLSVVAEAEKPIRGVVKDIDTGAPRAGVEVTLSRSGNDLLPIPVSATTDERGRYVIQGARKSGKGYMVEVAGDPASGHLACQARASDTPGYGAITIDVRVKRGVVVTGRVLDGKTRKPLPAWVMVSPLDGNRHARDFPEFASSAGADEMVPTGDDGTFRVVSIPGPVILMAGPDMARVPEGELAVFR